MKKIATILVVCIMVISCSVTKKKNFLSEEYLPHVTSLQVENLLNDKMIDKYIFSRDCYFDKYDIVNDFFMENHRKDTIYSYEGVNAIVQQLKYYDIDSPSMYDVLENIKVTDADISGIEMRALLKGSTLYNIMQLGEVKSNIVNGLRKSSYSFNDFESLSNSFLDDNITLPELLNDITTISTLPHDTLKTNEEVLSSLELMLATSFDNWQEIISISNQDGFALNTSVSSYPLIIPKTYDGYKVTDELYYWRIGKYFSQIAADLNLGFKYDAIGIPRILDENLFPVKGNMSYLTKGFEGSFLIKHPSDEEISYEWIDLVYGESEENCRTGLELVGLDPNKERKKKYISIEAKMQYFDFLKERTTEQHNLDPNSFPFNKPFDLSEFFKYSSYLADFYNGGSSTNIDQYYDDEKEGTLSSKMPKIYKVMNGDIELSGLNIEKSKIYFKHNGIEYQSKKYLSDFWNIMSELLVKIDNEKKLYSPKLYLDNNSMVLYYLSSQEKETLEGILDVPLNIYSK